MQNELHVALVQSDLVWENREKNRQNFEKKLSSIPKNTDLIVLPEMFTTGFTMNPERVFETMDGVSVTWMQHMASKYNSAITGSIVIKEHNNYYNRLLFVRPDASIEHYDKRHTFTLAGEDKVYTAGTSKLIIDYKGWKICPLICYDLRFPVWSRNTEDYDLLIYVANWPKKRIAAWDTLLKARAIENMSYCIGVNRVGIDANKYKYTGHTACYDVLGEKIATTPSGAENVAYITLRKESSTALRAKLQFLNDRDSFSIN